MGDEEIEEAGKVSVVSGAVRQTVGRGGLPPRRAVRRGSIVEGGMNQGTSPRTSIIQLLR